MRQLGGCRLRFAAEAVYDASALRFRGGQAQDAGGDGILEGHTLGGGIYGLVHYFSS